MDLSNKFCSTDLIITFKDTVLISCKNRSTLLNSYLVLMIIACRNCQSGIVHYNTALMNDWWISIFLDFFLFTTLEPICHFIDSLFPNLFLSKNSCCWLVTRMSLYHNNIITTRAFRFLNYSFCRFSSPSTSLSAGIILSSLPLLYPIPQDLDVAVHILPTLFELVFFLMSSKNCI